jgi:hypothetical protein
MDAAESMVLRWFAVRLKSFAFSRAGRWVEMFRAAEPVRGPSLTVIAA